MKKGEKKPKVRKPGYVGAKKFWAWESRELSDAASMFLLGYIMFYCTDVLQINAALVGTLLAASKVVDGITDVIAGYLVDRTNTRWGRGRPYDLCLLGAWFSIIMIFACPTEWSSGAKIAWVVIWYTLSSAVFYTLLNAGEGVFMLRAFNKDQIIKLNTQGSIATSLLGFCCGIFVPQMVNAAGTSQSAWLKLAATVGIPLALVGMCRMIFVKEENDTVRTVEEKTRTDLKEIFSMLRKNKYWMIFCLVTLVSNIVSNIGVGVYYFDKILGNIGLQSIFGAFSALAVFALVLLPKLMKRFPLARIILVGCLISGALNVIAFIFYKNIPVLVFCYVGGVFATLPSIYAGRILLCDAALYNEYLGLNRMEGTMNSMNGFMTRAGGALGTFFLGVILEVIRYDAAAETLEPITFWGLRCTMYLLPLASAVIQALLWSRYDLDQKLPEIEKTVEQRIEKEAAAEAVEDISIPGQTPRQY